MSPALRNSSLILSKIVLVPEPIMELSADIFSRNISEARMYCYCYKAQYYWLPSFDFSITAGANSNEGIEETKSAAIMIVILTKINLLQEFLDLCTTIAILSFLSILIPVTVIS